MGDEVNGKKPSQDGSNNHTFSFDDGSSVINLEEFLFKIKNLPEKDSKKYIKKGDYIEWVETSLHKKGLANLLSEITKTDDLILVLETYINHDKPKKNQRIEKESIEKEELIETRTKKRTEEIDISKKKKESKEEEFIEEELKETLEDKYEDHKNSANNYQDNEYHYEHKPTKNTTEYKLKEEKSNSKEEYHIASDGEEVIPEAKAKEYARLINEATIQITKVVKGQDDIIRKSFIALLCSAHILLEGVPGLAKSLLVETFNKTMSGTTSKRIQFLPDMLPSDILGSQMYNPKENKFITIKGPIFGNFILADEVNRAPPKTHAALMECMQEKKVTIDKETYPLEKPFIVFATQNPLENKGTYELPEAVLDRFLFKLILDYPPRKDEKNIITQNSTTKRNIMDDVKVIFNKEKLLEMQKNVSKIYLSNKIKEYIMNIIEATRGLNKSITGMKFISYGAGPRGTISLGIAAKAQAILNGRNFVLPEDVENVGIAILRHRLALNFHGKAHNISTDKVVKEIFSKTRNM